MSGSNNKSKGDNMIGADQLASDLSPTREKSSRWMPSKMRLMRKMMSSSYPHEKGQQTSSGESCCNSTSSPDGPPARVCSDCKTTKTPLWRSGPQGPKSLCNACGIRKRKARKAMAAAAAASVTGGPCGKEKGYDSCNAVIPHNKRFKLEEARRKIKLEDHNINLKNNLALHPQDEKEAAILLMALSCDLIYF